uniref:Uncharacterized protein n=1 Tax=Grammatophora oceanica TaxID=210454 RepID=A0A7S1Y7I4_9STRA|mmetsp:Transcript_33717/g.49991  ORF Transcript_33717/g.49991 Transcript_33717/m.49991 type:complete len:141 (+) Transcript_33717:67-489(+)|eukprot:CAMPEP_0194028008 /NCGR_PEP_ID=MMETSP0009_2-20130614/2037_1 /TAXON_ID=210454 /ORGANISM="Grammatophora oceanica, Strain CCMP 410" /LENGTH=140 /DNA_ID=CAMNT_0038667239 /DNA_START=81 /DNA_END=503 /DNA_ORIENTATION=+
MKTAAALTLLLAANVDAFTSSPRTTFGVATTELNAYRRGAVAYLEDLDEDGNPIHTPEERSALFADEMSKVATNEGVAEEQMAAAAAAPIPEPVAVADPLEQPKTADEEADLAAKYSDLDKEELCFQVLSDLGLCEEDEE